MKKYCVIGNPIEHSLSPKLQNFWIRKNNISAVYDKIKLEEKEIENFINEIKKQNITGANVTVPFKKSVIPFLDKLTPEAKKTQSVNTIYLESNYLIGHNTDIGGFEHAIRKLNMNISKKKFFILGAGGVVPSIIFALHKMKILNIMVSNRTKVKVENLKTQFEDIEIVDWGKIPEFDVIINATSLGLKGETLNLDLSKVGSNKLFYDVIYNPSETNFLKNGKKLGNSTENGRLMFIYQAREAFKIWHGLEPEVNNDTIEILKND